MSLFKRKKFISHSGKSLDFKIECDMLKNSDWEAIAFIIHVKMRFQSVTGIPRGGLKLAKKLEQYTEVGNKTLPHLIVDDVLTTGKSMEKMRDELVYVERKTQGGILGVVLFSRQSVEDEDLLGWVFPIFQIWK